MEKGTVDFHLSLISLLLRLFRCLSYLSYSQIQLKGYLWELFRLSVIFVTLETKL